MGRRRWWVRLGLASATLALVAAACGGGAGEEGAPPAGATPSPEAPSPEAPSPSPSPGEPVEGETVPGEGRFDWLVVEIDRGVKPDLALDAEGRAHIAYGLEAMPGFVRHALVADRVTTSTVAEGYFYFPLEIALDRDGVPWIAWHNHDFEDQAVAVLEDPAAGTWRVLRTESPNHDGWDNSLVLDASGRPHTVSIDPAGFGSDVGLEYGFFDGTVWTVEEVGTGPLMYEFGTSLALDSAGNPHVVFYNDAAGDLMYAVRSNGSWTVSAVDSEGDVGRFSDMLIDGEGRPRIAYLEVTGETTGAIKYAVFDGSRWSIERVDELSTFFIGPVGNMTGARNVVSIALDSTGNPVLAYSDQQTIKLAWRQGDRWEIETVLTAGEDPLGQTVSLALDPSDTPHLTYFVATDLGVLDGLVYYVKGVPKAS